MNPNQAPGPEGQEPPVPSPEVTPEPPTAPVEQEYSPAQQASPEQLDTDQMTAAQNPYTPPPPGNFQPDYSPDKESLSTPAKVPYVDTTHETEANLPVSEDMQKKRAQAKRLLAIAIGFGALFVIGLGAVTILFISGRESEQEAARVLSVDEQLSEDLNTFALAVINFRNGSDFFNITAEDVAELKTSYLPRMFDDPRTDQAYAVTNEIPRAGEIQYIPSAICSEDDSISLSDDDRNFAARVLLESGTLLCIQTSEVMQPTNSN